MAWSPTTTIAHVARRLLAGSGVMAMTDLGMMCAGTAMTSPAEFPSVHLLGDIHQAPHSESAADKPSETKAFPQPPSAPQFLAIRPHLHPVLVKHLKFQLVN